MVSKLLPSTKPTPPRSLDVSQATTKGVLVFIPYERSPGANTLTLDSSLTNQVV